MAAPGAWTIPDTSNFKKYFDGTFDFDSDSFKVALFKSTSNLSVATTTYAALTNEATNGNGYSTGGVAVTMTLAGSSTQKWTWSAAPTWTASGGNIVARFAVLYEVGGNVVCYCLLDSAPADYTILDGNTFTLNAHGSGIWSATHA